VELDPGYAKGWARLAVAQQVDIPYLTNSVSWLTLYQALGNVPASIESWEKAIAALPERPNPAEQRHKAQYEAALEAAHKGQLKFERRSKKDHNVLEIYDTGDMPWDIAARMMSQWERGGNIDTTSSAWLIYEAHDVTYSCQHPEQNYSYSHRACKKG
jgi:hypothetical protein